MRLRLRLSLRSRVIGVGVVTTVVALIVTFLIAGTIGSSRNALNQRNENTATINLIARFLDSGTHVSISQFSELLLAENQRATLTINGHTTVVGDPLKSVENPVSMTVRVSGGTLTIASPLDNRLDPPIYIVLITFGVLLVVLGSLFLANRSVNRQTRSRVDDAVRAAERVSLGDFTARIGSGGPEVLVRLGSAFDAMASRLESIDREQREFLADLAHEIATPIQALSGFSQGVIDGTIPIETAREAIESQTARLSELLDELTQLRSLDAPGEGHFDEVDLHALVHSLHKEFEPTASAAGVDLQCHSEHVNLVTDQKLVETVLRNFVTNALRYTPRGQRIDIGCRVVHRQVVLSVADTGIGIAPEHQQRIFDRFFRTAEARDRISGGTGLGLTIARRAAHSLGGHIELESEPGRGSDFRLVLPQNSSASR
ncbi:MAG: HAMP domain-containing histidine kinase [Acidobacteria bacterium]|nr:HAMP domain-containing histidine kinase [Acidobacteriota bacterium]